MIAIFLLILGIALTVIAGAALGWYPARIGGPSFWLDEHLYQPVLTLLTPTSSWVIAGGVLFLGALILSFGGYALGARWAFRLRRGSRHHLWLIVGVQLAISVWLIFQPYLSSQDIFSYAFYSHIFAWYHDNPYVAVPRDYPYDPLFSAIFWKDQPSNYGPLWTYLSASAPLVAGARVGLTLVALKVITVAAAVAGTPLLWSSLGALRPERRILGTLLYAWNPLLLIESAEAGHNDAVMAFFLIASLWLWCRGRRTSAISALVLAALVKYVAVILIPLYLIAWWRESGESPWRILSRSAAVGVGLSVLAFAPLYAGPATFAVVGFGSNPLAYTNSPLELVFREARLALGDSPQIADLPLHYDGRWIASESSAILWTVPDEKQGTGILLPPGTPLLMVEPATASWVHVYEPKLGRFGFIRERLSRPIAAPATSAVPGTTAAVLAGVSQDPDAQRANDLVRLLSLLVFVPWYLFTLRRVARCATDPTTLPRAAVGVLVVYLLAVQSWFWPWYLIWLLPFVAIVPDSGAALVALAMTATTSMLNAQPSVSPPPFLDWLYGSRVILIYGLPLAFAAWWVNGRRRYRVSVNAVGVPRAVIRLMQARFRFSDHTDAFPVARGLVPRPAGRARDKPPRYDPLRDDLDDTTQRRRRTGDDASGTTAPLSLARRYLVRGLAILLLLLLPLFEVASRPLAEPPPTIIAWQQAFDEALRLYSAGDYQGAVDQLSMVLVALPEDRSVLQLRVAANLALGRYPQTIPDLTTLLRNDPDDAALHLERGIMYAQVQRGDLALVDFQYVMRAQPSSADAYERAGLVEFDMGDLASARRQLERARALAPRDSQIARELGNVLASENDAPGALALYNTAIRLDPSEARAYADRAALLRHLGSTDATIPDLKKVRVLSSDIQQQQWAAQLLANLSAANPKSERPAG